MNNYIYIASDYFEKDAKIFSDLNTLENYQLCFSKIIQPKNILIRFLKKIHLSYKINKIVKLPCKWIWYELKNLKLNKKNNNIIIVNSDALCDYDISFFKHIQNTYRNKVHFVLLLLDSVNVKTPVGEAIRKNYQLKIWKYVFTYDKSDAEKYNMQYLNEQYYSKRQIPMKEKNSDTYFVGALKPGREKNIIDVFKKLKKDGLKNNFQIAKYHNNITNYQSQGFNFLYTKKSYTEVLEETVNTNCIVEILQDGQHAQTLRYFEAVCYNKKLLTNNENVKYLNFYNPKYIKIFKSANDIDCEWVKREDEVDYHYNGEFSPLNFISRLDQLFAQKDKK